LRWEIIELLENIRRNTSYNGVRNWALRMLDKFDTDEGLFKVCDINMLLNALNDKDYLFFVEYELLSRGR